MQTRLIVDRLSLAVFSLCAFGFISLVLMDYGYIGPFNLIGSAFAFLYRISLANIFPYDETFSSQATANTISITAILYFAGILVSFYSYSRKKMATLRLATLVAFLFELGLIATQPKYLLVHVFSIQVGTPFESFTNLWLLFVSGWLLFGLIIWRSKPSP